MLEGLSFGWRTAVLTAILAPLVPLVAGLLTTLANRSANRVLAALLVVLAGNATPWMIGFAGFYNKWQWLSFVPFAIPLAITPLLWMYVTALTTGRLPARWWLHLVPAALQVLLKVAQLATGPQRAVFLVEDIVLAVGLFAYGWHSLQQLRVYRTYLADQRSDDSRFAVRWLGRAILAVCALLLLNLAHKIWGLFDPLGYEGLMGYHVAIALTALYLGIEGWRHADRPFPAIAALGTTDREDRNWSALGREIEERLRGDRWYEDPSLSLDRLARLLGTNSNYVSRALNEGLGVGFSELVNRERSEAVARALDEGSDDSLLDLALEAGFASKATFNRAFKARHGVSPSTYRQRLKS